MTRMKSRSWLILLLVIAALALAGIVAGCGGNQNATTTSSGSTGTTAASTDSTSANSPTDSTIVQGGKTLDEYKGEIAGLEQAVTKDPQDLTSLEELAVAHYQLQEYDAAAEDYNKILAIQDDAFIRHALGNVYRDQKKYDDAIAQYDKAIALDPTLKFPYINEATVWAKFKGDMGKAQEILEKAKKALNAADAKTATNYQQMLTSTTTTPTT
jgi:tetratricopeptide (TPR) repeat protein